jgi:preprotein translocase subunit YajC
MTIPDAGSIFAMATPPDGMGFLLQIVPYVFIVLIFYFALLMPMKKKQQKVQQFLDNLKVNEKVITTGGIYGQITRLNEQTVQLQIADKVRIEVARASVGGYQGQEPVQEAVSERASS